MVVVAIVGVLATLAMYGVRKYIATAKTAEARNSLGQLSRDASAAYSREQMAGAVLASGGFAASNNAFCTAAAATVPASIASVKGQKYQSATAEWDAGSRTAGWQCLRFSLQEPQYYMYGYTLATPTSFSASAQGDLNGDGTSFSTFTRVGVVQGGVVTLAPNITELNAEE